MRGWGVCRSVLVGALLAGVWVFSGGGAAAQEDGPGEAPTDPLGPVRFMVGSWQHAAGDMVSEEHWLASAGGALFGVNVTTEAGATTAFEYLRVEARADGLVYVASPGGGPATEFRYVASESGPDRAVFVNPEHDFPTRISYWLEGDTLHAAIAGPDGEPAATWAWQRAGAE